MYSITVCTMLQCAQYYSVTVLQCAQYYSVYSVHSITVLLYYSVYIITVCTVLQCAQFVPCVQYNSVYSLPSVYSIYNTTRCMFVPGVQCYSVCSVSNLGTVCTLLQYHSACRMYNITVCTLCTLHCVYSTVQVLCVQGEYILSNALFSVVQENGGE